MIKMMTNTYCNGVSYKRGKEYELDEVTESRWIKSKIAIAIEGDNSSGSGDKDGILTIDLISMTDDQLTEYAESIGVDISRCTTRNGVIGKLEKAKQEQGAE